MVTKKTIYVIRHGQTDYNLRGIIQGSGIDSHLNETGRKQATLFHKNYEHHPFSKIYTSKLVRTFQSIEPFTHNDHIIKALPEFNEICWGEYEGMEITTKIEKEFFHIINRWTKGDINLSSDEGESPVQLASRLRTGIEQVMDDSGMENVLICTHGRSIKALACVLLDVPLAKMDTFKHSNLCLYKFETTDGKRFEMTLRNETSHLKELDLVI